MAVFALTLMVVPQTCRLPIAPPRKHLSSLRLLRLWNLGFRAAEIVDDLLNGSPANTNGNVTATVAILRGAALSTRHKQQQRDSENYE